MVKYEQPEVSSVIYLMQINSILLSLLSSLNINEAIKFVIQAYPALNDTPCIKSGIFNTLSII
jgi:hypothetical protein